MEKFKSLPAATRSTIITYAMVVIAFLIMQGLLSVGAVSNSTQGLLVPICAYICMAISLNLVVGISGELSLGHAGFMSVGAFTGVVVSTALAGSGTSGPVRLLVAIVAAGVSAAIAGLLIGIPVMRLRGDYLAIVTLAFGEIIKNLLNNLYVGLDVRGLHFSMSDAASLGMAEGGKVVINGPQGAVGIDMISSFTAGFLLILFTLFVVLNLVNSRSGRAIMAVRDNRIAAESVGINVTHYKMMAFVTSAAMAGAAGALFALNYSTIVANKFDFNTSILVLVFVVFGGLGNMLGSVIAAAALTILPEALRSFASYRMLIYAIVLILVMLATNNPTLKGFFASLRGRFNKNSEKEASAS